MIVTLHEVVTAQLRVDAGQGGELGHGDLLLPDEAGELCVDVGGLTELTVVAQGVEQLGQTLQLGYPVAWVLLVQPSQDVDAGSVHRRSCRVPASLAQEAAEVETELQGLAGVGDLDLVVSGGAEF